MKISSFLCKNLFLILYDLINDPINLSLKLEEIFHKLNKEMIPLQILNILFDRGFNTFNYMLNKIDKYDFVSKAIVYLYHNYEQFFIYKKTLQLQLADINIKKSRNRFK